MYIIIGRSYSVDCIQVNHSVFIGAPFINYIGEHLDILNLAIPGKTCELLEAHARGIIGYRFQMLIEKSMFVAGAEANQGKAMRAYFIYGNQLASGFYAYAIAYINHFFIYHFCLQNKKFREYFKLQNKLRLVYYNRQVSLCFIWEFKF